MTDVTTDAPELPMKENAFNLWTIYETDPDAEENGAWIELAPGTSFKLRRFQSKHSLETRKVLEKPYAATLRSGKALPEAVAEELVTQQMARSIIVDWKGVPGRDGNPMDFSVDNVLVLLKGLPHLRNELVAQVLEIDNFRQTEREDAVGN